MACFENIVKNNTINKNHTKQKYIKSSNPSPKRIQLNKSKLYGG